MDQPHLITEARAQFLKAGLGGGQVDELAFLNQRTDPIGARAAIQRPGQMIDDLGHARERVQRHAEDIGTGFRIIGESDERPWPVSPVPLLIGQQEWAGIAAGAACSGVVAEVNALAGNVADGSNSKASRAVRRSIAMIRLAWHAASPIDACAAAGDHLGRQSGFAAVVVRRPPDRARLAGVCLEASLTCSGTAS